MVYTGESAEDVRQIIKNDIYATSGVWDIEKVQIYPVSWYLDSLCGFQLISRRF